MYRQLLIAKKETAYGTDAGPLAANTVWAENVSWKVTGQRVSPNPAKPGVGPVQDWTYGEHVEMSFEIPLNGSGTPGTPPNWGFLMKACGWAETVVAATSVTYPLAFDPLAADSLTLVWRDGNRRLHKVLGFRGRVGLKLNAGERPMLVFTGKGLHVDVTTGAALAQADAVFTNWKDARPVAQGTTTFSLNSITGLGVRAFSIDQSDNVKFVDVPEQENVELRGERIFTGQGKITTPLASTLNLETLWKAATVVPYSVVHGSTPGQIVAVNGRGQVVDPSYAIENDFDVASFNLKHVPSSLVTDDDLAIVLT